MAGFYWYERNPQLFNDEKQAMNLYFPNFVLDRLADGRICWVGNLNPRCRWWNMDFNGRVRS